MRTAEAILKENGVYMTDFISSSSHAGVTEAMKQYAKEAIEECIEKSQIICEKADYNGGNLNVKFAVDVDVYKLIINELK